MKIGWLGLTVCIGALGGFFSHVFPEQNTSLIEALAVVAFSLPALFASIQTLGARYGVSLVFFLYCFAIGIETIGIKSGFPYGAFSYHSFSEGFRFFDVTPWTVGFAWFPIILGSYALTSRFAQGALSRIIFTITLVVCYDLVLDPVAVARGYWGFVENGLYYSVPFSNYAGWILSGTIGAMITEYFVKGNLLIYAPYSLVIHLGFFTTAALLLGLWIPVCVGCFLIGGTLSVHFIRRKS